MSKPGVYPLAPSIDCTTLCDAWRRFPPSIAEDLSVRFPPEFIKATVFVGIENNGRFTPVGTGFLINVRHKEHFFNFVVTAHHVVEMIKGDTVWIRMNRRSGGCSTVYVDKSSVITHVRYNNDLAMFPSSFDPSLFDQKFVLANSVDYKNRDHVWSPDVGDEVATVGLYSNHQGENSNLPVVRVGHISLMPGEEVYSHRGYVKAYLIEIKSIAGLSGSPVYINLPLIKHLADGQMVTLQSPSAIPLGVLTGYHLTRSAEDQILVPRRDDDAKKDDESPSLDERNTGFAVVVPWERVIEMVEADDVVAKMDNGVANYAAGMRARPAGVILPQEISDGPSAFRA